MWLFLIVNLISSSAAASLLTVTWPFLSQVDHCYYGQVIVAFGNNDPQWLTVMTHTFQRVTFMAIVGIELALGKIDVSFFDHLFHLGFINMPALHSAPCMFRIMNCFRIPIKLLCSVSAANKSEKNYHQITKNDVLLHLRTKISARPVRSVP